MPVPGLLSHIHSWPTSGAPLPLTSGHYNNSSWLVHGAMQCCTLQTAHTYILYRQLLIIIFYYQALHSVTSCGALRTKPLPLPTRGLEHQLTLHCSQQHCYMLIICILLSQSHSIYNHNYSCEIINLHEINCLAICIKAYIYNVNQECTRTSELWWVVHLMLQAGFGLTNATISAAITP